MSCDCRNNNGSDAVSQMLLWGIFFAVMFGSSKLAAAFEALLWVGGGCLALYIIWKLLGLVLSRWWIAVPAGILALYASHEYMWPKWVDVVIGLAILIGAGIISIDDNWLEPMDIEARRRVYSAMPIEEQQ